MPKRLGFFTRLLDQGSAQTRYRLAAEQIRHAERLGFDSAWIAHCLLYTSPSPRD